MFKPFLSHRLRVKPLSRFLISYARRILHVRFSSNANRLLEHFRRFERMGGIDICSFRTVSVSFGWNSNRLRSRPQWFYGSANNYRRLSIGTNSVVTGYCNRLELLTWPNRKGVQGVLLRGRRRRNIVIGRYNSLAGVHGTIDGSIRQFGCVQKDTNCLTLK